VIYENKTFTKICNKYLVTEVTCSASFDGIKPPGKSQTVADPADFQRGRWSGGAAKRYLIGGAVRPSRQLSNSPIGAIFSAKQAAIKRVILDVSGRRAALAVRSRMLGLHDD
jgi:hypothetical protein